VCHKFARKEKKRTLTQPNESLGRDSVILWKTFPLSSERRYCAQPISKIRESTGHPAYERSSHRGGMADLRMHWTQKHTSACERQNEVLKTSLGKYLLDK
jgi:hypothetical protein